MNIINSVIHAAADAEVSAYTYTKIYASVTASPVINGTTVPLVAGFTIELLVKTITPTANVFVIGYSKLLERSPTVING
tara:strand:- start:14957 stop:15193 length:237 start_codon:yes stop_codon:yes gene_type:complete